MKSSAHARVLRPRGVRRRLAITPPTVLPSASVNSVGTPNSTLRGSIACLHDPYRRFAAALASGRRTARGHRVSLALRCRELPSPSSCRLSGAFQRSSANAAVGGLKPPPVGRLQRAKQPPSLLQHRNQRNHHQTTDPPPAFAFTTSPCPVYPGHFLSPTNVNRTPASPGQVVLVFRDSLRGALLTRETVVLAASVGLLQLAAGGDCPCRLDLPAAVCVQSVV